jgi:hypothetical protein
MTNTDGVQPSLGKPESRALAELQEVIRDRYPTAQFRVRSGVDDPETTYLIATVDVEDPDDVLDLVIDRLVQFQIDEGLAISVLPIHPPERVLQTMRQVSERHSFTPVPVLPAR